MQAKRRAINQKKNFLFTNINFEIKLSAYYETKIKFVEDTFGKQNSSLCKLFLP